MLSRPLKVLHCITDLPAHGAQKMLLKVIGGMDKQRFDNFVVSLVPGGTLESDFEDAGIQQANLGMRRGEPSLAGVWKFRNLIRSYKPDLIQGWLYHGNLMATIGSLVSGHKAPVVWNIRRALYALGDDKPLTRSVIRAGAFFSWQPSLILHNASVSVEQHVKFGYRDGKHRVIANCFNTQDFKPNSDARRQIREELDIPSEATVVGIVGRYHPQKDYECFAKAAALAISQFPDVHFIMVGDNVTASNSELSQYLEGALGDQYPAAIKNFHRLGPRSDIANVMAAFDIYCSASANEGFPNVVGEAMSCGVPCAVTDAGATGDLVEGVGLVVGRKNESALGAALCKFIGMTSEEREQIGAKSRARILEQFSIDSIVQQYSTCYSELSN